jgi:hypothetical protein
MVQSVGINRLVALALNLGLMVLARLGALTFSMNAVLVPVLFLCLLSLLALRLQAAGRNRLAQLSALLAGICLGIATLIRLPSFLLAPGIVILLWPGFRKFRVMSLPVALAVGATVVRRDPGSDKSAFRCRRMVSLDVCTC